MDLEKYALGAILLVIIILFFWVIWLQNKLGKLLVGKSRNLDESFETLTNQVQGLQKFQQSAEATFKNHEARLKKAISGVETVRFDPFKGTGSGGKQSFATAFINEEKNGVIISSLYSRDHVSIFSKPISGARSEFELTTEEKTALEVASQQIKAK